MLKVHCKTQQVEPAYIEWGNGAAAMQVSPVNLLDMKIWSLLEISQYNLI